MISWQSTDTRHVERAIGSDEGFCWWYFDMVDTSGDGLVLIWSFRLPFLPNTKPIQTTSTRPALVVALYRAGRPAFYLLQELSQQDAHWPEGAGNTTFGPTIQRFGDSVITLRQCRGQFSLRVQLDMPLPASAGRLTGTVDTGGARCQLHHGAASSVSSAPGVVFHNWAPLMTATHGHAQLKWGDAAGDTMDLLGRCYLDSNASNAPLQKLGIGHWSWGRASIGDRELIYYQLRPEDDAQPTKQRVLLVEENGVAQPIEAHVLWHDKRRARYGLSYHKMLTIQGPDCDVTLRCATPVDDGPFYLRSLLHAVGAGSAGDCLGVCETVVPGAIDVAWQRPFVRMRRHMPDGPNSMWLPLFSGDQRGRFRRLASQLWSTFR